jgi:hypothetical protein
MIKGLTATDGYTIVSGGSHSGMYVDSSRPFAGSVKYDTSLQSLVVFDGSIWLQMPDTYATVGLNAIAEQAIIWATGKMQEEAEHKKLANNNPAIQIALDNLAKAKQQLDVTIILSKEHDKV